MSICHVCNGCLIHTTPKHDAIQETGENNLWKCLICQVCVHANCYGISPKSYSEKEREEWICDPCMFAEPPNLTCTLCMKQCGAFKYSQDGASWVHVCCVLSSHEFGFQDKSLLFNPVIWISERQSRIQCVICGVGGAVPRCAFRNCSKTMHIICCRENGGKIEWNGEDGHFTLYCSLHCASSGAKGKDKGKRSEGVGVGELEALPSKPKPKLKPKPRPVVAPTIRTDTTLDTNMMDMNMYLDEVKGAGSGGGGIASSSAVKSVSAKLIQPVPGTLGLHLHDLEKKESEGEGEGARNNNKKKRQRETVTRTAPTQTNMDMDTFPDDFPEFAEMKERERKEKEKEEKERKERARIESERKRIKKRVKTPSNNNLTDIVMLRTNCTRREANTALIQHLTVDDACQNLLSGTDRQLELGASQQLDMSMDMSYDDDDLDLDEEGGRGKGKGKGKEEMPSRRKKRKVDGEGDSSDDDGEGGGDEGDYIGPFPYSFQARVLWQSQRGGWNAPENKEEAKEKDVKVLNMFTQKLKGGPVPVTFHYSAPRRWGHWYQHHSSRARVKILNRKHRKHDMVVKGMYDGVGDDCLVLDFDTDLPPGIRNYQAAFYVDRIVYPVNHDVINDRLGSGNMKVDVMCDIYVPRKELQYNGDGYLQNGKGATSHNLMKLAQFLLDKGRYHYQIVERCTDSPYWTSCPSVFNSEGDKYVEPAGNPLSIANLFRATRPIRTSPSMRQPDGLSVQMTPFQRRALYWMLAREKGSAGTEDRGALHPFWEELTLKAKSCLDIAGAGANKRKGAAPSQSHATKRFTVYKSIYGNTVSLCKPIVPKLEPGGILADEMGLGKTIVCLGLILAHPRTPQSPDRSRSRLLINEGDHDVQTVKTTLIVIPRSLKGQWIDEISGKSTLDFTVYDPFESSSAALAAAAAGGSSSSSSSGRSMYASQRPSRSRRVTARYGDDEKGKARVKIKTLIDEWSRSDILLTTYDVLEAEILEYKQSPSSFTSPLLAVQFWRVLLDEGQMVRDSNSEAASMGSELWRVNCWAVTGTPFSSGINDLHGLLVFLDSDPWANKPALSRFMIDPYLRGEHKKLRGFIPKILWRSERVDVENEIHLPGCEEIVVHVKLSSAERTIYELQRTEATVHIDNLLRSQITAFDRAIQESLRKEQEATAQGKPKPKPENLPTLGLSMTRAVSQILLPVRQAASSPNIIDARRHGRGGGVGGGVGGAWNMNIDGLGLGLGKNEQKREKKQKEKEKRTMEEALTDMLQKSMVELDAANREVAKVCNRLSQLLLNSIRGYRTGDEAVFRGEFDYGSAELTEQEVEEERTKEMLLLELISHEPDEETATRFEIRDYRVQKRAATAQLDAIYRARKKREEAMNPEKMEKLMKRMKERAQKHFQEDAPTKSARAMSLLKDAYDFAENGLQLAAGDIESKKDRNGLSSLERKWLTLKHHTCILLAGSALKASGGGDGSIESEERLDRRWNLPRDVEKADEAISIGSILALKKPFRTSESSGEWVGNGMAGAEDEYDKVLRTKRQAESSLSYLQQRKKDTATATAPVQHKGKKSVGGSGGEDEGEVVGSSSGGGSGRDDKGKGKVAATTTTTTTGHPPNTQSQHFDPSLDIDNDIGECPICMELFDDAVLLPCAHEFCSECLVGLLHSKSNRKAPCPICRVEFTERDMEHIRSDPEPITLPELGLELDLDIESDGVGVNKGKGKGEGKGKGKGKESPSSSSSRSPIIERMISKYGSKVGALCDDVLKSVAADGTWKGIVFSQFSRLINICVVALRELGVECDFLTGTDINREGVLQEFRTGKMKILFISMKYSDSEGAAGLTLTMASTAYLLDPSLTFGLEQQSIGRINRIGQTKHTKVVRFISEGTIEDKVFELRMKALAGRKPSSIRDATHEVLGTLNMKMPGYYSRKFTHLR